MSGTTAVSTAAVMPARTTSLRHDGDAVDDERAPSGERHGREDEQEHDHAEHRPLHRVLVPGRLSRDEHREPPGESGQLTLFGGGRPAQAAERGEPGEDLRALLSP